MSTSRIVAAHGESALKFSVVSPTANHLRVAVSFSDATPNRRYTTDLSIFSATQATGWTFEGNGDTKVFACVPQ